MLQRQLLKLLAALFGWPALEEDKYFDESVEATRRYIDGYVRIQDNATWTYEQGRLYASHDDGETWIPMMTPNDWEGIETCQH